jgi:predicted aspartyl protease
VIRSVGQVWVSLDGRSGIVPVAFGNRGEQVLLGATTLEILGFVVDPIDQKLLPRPLRDK